ncbi:MAG: 6-phosphogluconolactonase [Chlamydiae bacterium]|nr:6-phosphogluconolactonase [Chlamydiota bacterium]
MNLENLKINPWDDRRNLLIPGDQVATLDVCLRHFVAVCKSAVQERGKFFVALAGGSTPKALYERLCVSPNAEEIPWESIYLFWGDERSVPKDHEESNYRMAMDAGFSKMAIPKEQIFRMPAEEKIEENAQKYEETIKQVLGENPFDLVILGMGDDGHTASLFPQTEALKAQDRLAVANYVPQKETWRMTLTFECINSAHNIVIYAMGAAKQHTLAEVLTSEEQFDRFPIQKIGTQAHRALWIIDESAAASLEIE